MIAVRHTGAYRVNFVAEPAGTAVIVARNICTGGLLRTDWWVRPFAFIAAPSNAQVSTLDQPHCSDSTENFKKTDASMSA